jgi:hypothetical protein
MPSFSHAIGQCGRSPRHDRALRTLAAVDLGEYEPIAAKIHPLALSCVVCTHHTAWSGHGTLAASLQRSDRKSGRVITRHAA